MQFRTSLASRRATDSSNTAVFRGAQTTGCLNRVHWLDSGCSADVKLGGSNGIANLYPEDKLENRLYGMVCEGKMRLPGA